MESEHSSLVESHEQLQTRLASYDVPTSSNLIEEHAKLKEEISLYIETNDYLESLVTKYGLDYYPSSSTCEQATILEENARLKDELTKSSMAQCEHALNKIMVSRVLAMLPRRRTTRKRARALKQRRTTQLVVIPLKRGQILGRIIRPQGADYPVPRMTLQESLILTTFCIMIIMVMSMQNMLVPLMVILITLFGFLRP